MYYPHNFKVSSTILDSDGMIMHANVHKCRWTLLRFVSQSYHIINMSSCSLSVVLVGLDLHTVSYYSPPVDQVNNYLKYTHRVGVCTLLNKLWKDCVWTWHTSKPDMVGFKDIIFFFFGDSLFLWDILSSFFDNALLFDKVLSAWVI